jgi:ribosome biogenesis GTPase
MIGKVIKSTGSWYKVKVQNMVVDCKIKGKFRTLEIKTTNPVAVGDWVDLEMENDEFGVITSIQNRKNYLIRRSVNLSKQYHILAANIDLAIIIVTIHKPQTSLEFIDRFLVSAQAYGIPAAIIVNKTDEITSEQHQDDLSNLMMIYETIGYPVILTSATQGKNLSEVRELLKDKTTVVSGHSGVGKSTLLNAIQPDLNITTSAISEAHDQGKHTTTFAELHNLDFGGEIIDTPGIRGLDVVDIDPQELPNFFPEFLALLPQCKFSNCKHLNEPNCAVKNNFELEESNIYASRYRSYLNILGDNPQKFR